MILIISKNFEPTTTEIIKWLSIMGKKYIRIDENEIFEIKIYKKKIYIESHKNKFFIDEISSLWYRRGKLNFKRLQYNNPQINIHMNDVQHWLEDYIINTIESKKNVNMFTNSHINKLFVLEQAKKVGLDIPNYFLANNTDEVLIEKTIVKTIAGNPIIDNISHYLNGIMYTSLVKKKEKKSFFISFFQEKIEKDFEIRVFFLNGKCWSMAIFSQNDNQTKIDFRKYNLEKPNRNVRYNLPLEIEKKIISLMKILNLNCGSIDFIKKENYYYFLEINPIGQFLDLSNECNYCLQKEIAKYL